MARNNYSCKYSCPIPGHESAAAGVTWSYTNPGLPRELFSYDTEVCFVWNDWLRCTGTYSATTRKHIGWYMQLLSDYVNRTFGFSTRWNYYTAKELFENDMELNIVTGEIRKIERAAA